MTNINQHRTADTDTLHNHQENSPADEIIGPNAPDIDDFNNMNVINEHHHETRTAAAGLGGAAVLESSANGSLAPTVAMANDQQIANGHHNQQVHYRKALPKTASHADLSHKHIAGIRPLSIVRTSSYAPSLSGQSRRSDMEHLLAPPPSTPHEKSKHTRRYFATVFAISWAIFLVIFGLVVFIADAVLKEGRVYPVGESFAIFMISLSFLYFIFLYVDIRLHVRKAKLTIRERERRQLMYAEHLQRMTELMTAAEQQQQQQQLEEEFGGGGGVAFQVSDEVIQQQLRLPPLAPVSHKYCFMTGRHGEFFYLKFGASWFALGLLVHAILQIAYQIVFLTTRDQEFCASEITLTLDILFPLYSLFVLFFIFKYMNVIINEYRGLARIMLMHALGTSLAMWIYTIVTETANAIEIAQYIEEDTEVLHECARPDVLNFIHRNISPYLYPFIIEFCILIVGIFYMMWANISHCPRKYSALGHGHEGGSHGGGGGHGHGLENGGFVEAHGDVRGLEEGQQQQQHHDNRMSKGSERAQSVMSDDHCGTTTDHDQQFKSNLVVYADCHASNRGLFAGLILVVVTIVFIILFFIATSQDGYLEVGILVNQIFQLVVLVIMLIAVVVAYFQISRLDINHHPMSMLDDMLLFIAVPAFFLETIFSMVPAVINGSGLNIALIFAQLIQILVQTPFIIDGLRRCANAPALRKSKPGRELVTFLTIANVSLWLVLTFSVKTNYTGDERYEFYGYILWNILNHISLPLIMFYRFHSSVCLVDMWRHSYEPEPAEH